MSFCHVEKEDECTQTEYLCLSSQLDIIHVLNLVDIYDSATLGYSKLQYFIMNKKCKLFRHLKEMSYSPHFHPNKKPLAFINICLTKMS